jgi:hypothetical protein
MIEHRCNFCKTAVATTNGEDLYMRGTSLVPGHPTYVKWPCFKCGRDVKWFKAEAKKEKQ